jgi:RHS repeat-associated protein
VSSANGTSWFTRDPSGRILGERCNGSFYFLFDGLGSVVGATNSTGAVVRTFHYDPWGKLTASTGTIFEPVRYAGYYFDYQTSLYKVGLRYYDPALGRWTQRDPLDQPLDEHGWNPYTYTGNDPINFADPSGMCDVHGWDFLNDLALCYYQAKDYVRELWRATPPWMRRCLIGGAAGGVAFGWLTRSPQGAVFGAVSGCLLGVSKSYRRFRA